MITKPYLLLPQQADIAKPLLVVVRLRRRTKTAESVVGGWHLRA